MASLSLVFDLLARDRASREIANVGNTAEQTGGKLGKLGQAAAAGLGGAVGAAAGNALGAVKNFASGAVDAFAAVEDATGAAGVQFGKALPQVVKFAEQAGKSFGLSKRAALDAQNEFGTLGKAAGLTGTDLAGFSGKLTGLAGDLASFKGTSTEQAIGAVGAALRGENEPLRAYGVLLDDATIRQEALKLGLIKTVKDGLSPANKTLAVQSAIFKQTKDAQGDYARTSTSTANTQKTLQAATEDAQAALGEKLAPAITKVRQGFLFAIQFLNDKAIPAFAALADKHGPALSRLVDNEVVPALRGLGNLLKNVVAPALESAGEFIVRNKDFLIPFAATVLTLVAAFKVYVGIQKVVTAVTAAYNAVLLLNPIGIVVVAIAALAAGLVVAYKRSETFRDIVKGAFGVVLGAADKLLAGFEAVLRGLGKVPGFGWAKTAADGIAKVRDRLDEVKDSLAKVPSTKKVTLTLAVNGINSVTAAAQKLDRLDRLPVGDGPGRGGRTLQRLSGLIAGSGAYVSNTYRTPAQNAAAGGSPTSYHLDRNNPAVDIAGPPGALDRLFPRIKALGPWRELLYRVPNHFDHIHVAHSGGMVSGSWPTLPGLRSDERPAILQTGERVLSRAEVAGASTVQQHVTIYGTNTIVADALAQNRRELAFALSTGV